MPESQGPHSQGLPSHVSWNTTLEADDSQGSCRSCLPRLSFSRSRRHQSVLFLVRGPQDISPYHQMHNPGFHCDPGFLHGSGPHTDPMVPLLPRKTFCQNLRLHLQVKRELGPLASSASRC